MDDDEFCGGPFRLSWLLPTGLVLLSLSIVVFFVWLFVTQTARAGF